MPESQGHLDVLTFHLSNQYLQEPLNFPGNFPGNPADDFEGQVRLSSDSNHKAIRKGKLRFVKAYITAALDHITCSGAHAFDVPGKIERLGQ